MISTRHIVTLENYLNPYYITGFSDAESCFHIVVAKGLKCRTGWEVQAKFEIHLHKKDRALLELIKVSLGGIGKIYSHDDYILYRVRTIEDLGCGRHVPCLDLDHGNFIVERFSDIHDKIIPFFDKYPFKGAKAKEFSDFGSSINKEQGTFNWKRFRDD